MKLILILGLCLLLVGCTATLADNFCNEKGFSGAATNEKWNGWKCRDSGTMCYGNKDVITYPDGGYRYQSEEDYRCYNESFE